MTPAKNKGPRQHRPDRAFSGACAVKDRWSAPGDCANTHCILHLWGWGALHFFRRAGGGNWVCLLGKLLLINGARTSMSEWYFPRYTRPALLVLPNLATSLWFVKARFSFYRLARIVSMSIALAHSLSSAAVNLVTNGDFETGDLAGWSQSGNTGFTGVSASSAHFGVGSFFGAFSGPVGSLGFISQTFTTIPGQSYVLDYWLSNDTGTPNQFQVSWNGIVQTNLINSGGFDYAEFVVPNLVATSTSTTLQFGFRQDPAFWHLDDVSVTAAGVAGVPDDGATAGLLAIAAVGLAMMRRQRR